MSSANLVTVPVQSPDAVWAAGCAGDIRRHQGPADVEHKLRLARVNVTHVVIVLVPPQLGQAEHLVPSTGFTQNLRIY